MRSHSFLLLAFLCGATPAKARSQLREVWISSSTYGDPTALLVDLNQALNAHPSARRFRLRWGTAFPHGGDGGTLIYDKARQVLWIYQENNALWPQGEDEGEPGAIYNASYDSQQWGFSRVTPNQVRLLFQRYGHIKWNQEKFSDTAYEVSFFPRLSQFGCRGGLVKRTSSRWREKYIGGRRIRLR